VGFLTSDYVPRGDKSLITSLSARLAQLASHTVEFPLFMPINTRGKALQILRHIPPTVADTTACRVKSLDTRLATRPESSNKLQWQRYSVPDIINDWSQQDTAQL
jgi:hypothetical protein